MEFDGLVAVMLKRHCQDYKDGNSQYFMENSVTDYMLITYSRGGEIRDFKTLGHDGWAYFTRISPGGQALKFIVEQGSLDDCTLIFRYKDLVYTVRTCEYTIDPDGKIKEKGDRDTPKGNRKKILKATARLSGLKNLCPILESGKSPT